MRSPEQRPIPTPENRTPKQETQTKKPKIEEIAKIMTPEQKQEIDEKNEKLAAEITAKAEKLAAKQEENAHITTEEQMATDKVNEVIDDVVYRENLVEKINKTEEEIKNESEESRTERMKAEAMRAEEAIDDNLYRENLAKKVETQAQESEAAWQKETADMTNEEREELRQERAAEDATRAEAAIDAEVPGYIADNRENVMDQKPKSFFGKLKAWFNK